MELTKERLKEVLPKKTYKLVTNNMIDFLNNAEKDPLIIDEFRENFLTYSKVFNEGKFRMQDYVKAIRFVTYKGLGYTDLQSYSMVFPEKYQELIERHGEEQKDIISSYASNYKRTKLVSRIMEQTIIPSYIYNAPLFQEALLELTDIMRNSKSDIARVNAAGQILHYTEPPEEHKLQIEIGVKEGGVVSELKDAMKELANQQLKSIQRGTDVIEIAHKEIVTSKEED